MMDQKRIAWMKRNPFHNPEARKEIENRETTSGLLLLCIFKQDEEIKGGL
jgi:hypothetical protein